LDTSRLAALEHASRKTDRRISSAFSVNRRGEIRPERMGLKAGRI
jgi:hypothetical protein